MHGRIVQYSHSTGVGIIINNHKKLFDFKLINWHDKTRIPEINLLVEFKCDEDNLSVLSVKSSNYQEFGKDSIIKEADFWKTLTDDELERVELGVFEDLIAKVCKETNYENLSEIKPSISIENFLEYHFEAENHIIQIALKLPTGGYELLDYRILTRFLMRTLDSLIYTEKRITKDTFSQYLEIYSKLQYFVTPFYKASQDSAKIYAEVFLNQQLYFTAAKRKLLNTKDDLLRVESRLRMSRSQILSNEQKLSNAQNKQQNEVRERLEKLRAQFAELGEEKVRLTKLKEKLSVMIDAFQTRYEANFAKQFNTKKEQIFEQIKLALNTTITSLDNKMWDLAMKSEPIKNHYFKLDTNYSFCILAFVLQYLKMLDSAKLNDNDRILHSYIIRYRERRSKNILIVSNNDRIKNKLKIKLFSAYKDFSITAIEKKMEYEIIIANQHFDFVIIDDELEDGVPIEMVLFGKSKKHNKNAKFIVYQTKAV
ncbi:hypothetical protein [Helicobacter sp. 23-1045]